MNPEAPQERGLAVVAGVVSALVVIALCGAAGFLIGQNRVQKAKRGWNLVPVVTAARDLPAGAALKRGDVVDATAPEQFVTAQIQLSVSGLEGRTLLAPVAKGELVHFGHLSHAVPINPDCLERMRSTAASLGLANDTSVKALLADLKKKSGR